ncbi:metalloendopeptidase [Novosphingobium umbonatum]|uniref:Metalloendopeptidase n=2 Tax=Novosphingobium umbonatum TaxID=1908524 RepID=A0A437N5D8_9SPHN|nr:metalloendopeptidase [Novosphingobium umbonatum]
MADAKRQAEQARRRAEQLEASASNATAAVNKTATEAAAIAARIQQAEGDVAASEAKIRLIEQQRAVLRAQLAQKQRPLVELTAALQRLSRRPPVVSLLRPGTLRDTVHMRALLETMLPQVQRRTAALRVEIARARQLQAQAQAADVALRAEVATLASRRKALGVLEAGQRLAARQANGSAQREAELALALAEKARDLGALVGDLEVAAALRDRLARLSGPVLRPERPGETPLPIETESAAAQVLPDFMLPVAGRLVSGFGDSAAAGGGRGIILQVRGQAQVVAPAAGRVAFADSYAGYGRIVIIDHPAGWTSLVTGLGSLSVRVGDALVAGSPLGMAPAGRPQIMLELRHDGAPVNPLDPLRAR